MNKLSGLMGDRTGKNTQYQKVSQATYDALDDDRQLKNNNNDDVECVNNDSSARSSAFCASRSIKYFCLKHIWWVVVIALVLIISSMSGQMASNYDNQKAELVQNRAEVHNIQHRPCQAYPGSSFVKVLETGRGEASKHWAELPCLIHPSSFKNSDDMATNVNKNSWNYWLFGGTGSDADDDTTPIEYGMPSAQIQVNFDQMAHPKRQPILGFGGAFTEASALNLKSLNPQGQQAVMELLFGSTGLGYTLGRVHMNSCDFCVESYSFDDIDQDFDLQHFDMDVTHDVECGMMDFMLQASQLVTKSWKHSEMKIMASPWSPPAWMKQPTGYEDKNTSWLHAETMTFSAEPVCLLEGTGPGSRYAKTWALYFDKFITAYKNKGLSLFAVTVQNEPEFPAPWEACAYDPDNERDFVANFLGPQLRESHPEIQLLVFDHNKDHAPEWADTIMSSKEASKYVNGTAVHWYAGGMDRLLDGALGSPNMHRLVSILRQNNVSPDHLILGSEACHCPSTGYAGGDIRVGWDRAERYAHTILADLAAGSNGWVEWNLILDAYGGPNHLGNMCDSPLLAVPYRAKGAHNISKRAYFEAEDEPFGNTNGDDRTREELNAFGMPAEFLDLGVVVQPMYYYMGHISRYVRPGSRAVPALVNQANNNIRRTFRGGDTAGGGINNLARNGIEITTWPCEGSTRQLWHYIPQKGYLQVNGHDWLGKPTTSCIGKTPDTSLKGMTLTSCQQDADVGVLEIKPLDEKSSDSVNIVVTNSQEEDGYNCLVVKPLENGGGSLGSRGGSQVTIGDCSKSEAKWNLDENTGEITSHYFEDEDVCVTTGWPFLQVGAFLTPNADGHQKVVVILNEADEPANFIVRDNDQVLVTSSIRPHAIQTLLFD